MTKELVSFTVCPLYLILFVSEESALLDTYLPLDKDCRKFLANLDISTCSGLLKTLSKSRGMVDNLITNSFFSCFAESIV